jgi:SAM-dependent methyltransferase
MASGTLLVAELLCDAALIRAGETVLDVATGTGNTALAASRRRAKVTGVDVVASLLATARTRAELEGLTLTFAEGAAESLPVADGTFDAVLSTFGVMFSPHHERAAAELARACRPGGRLGVASWTPESFYGRLFETTDRFVPVTPGLGRATEWGTEEGVRVLLGPHADRIAVTSRRILVRSDSPEAFVVFLRRFFGPTVTAFAHATPSQAQDLEVEMLALVRGSNTFGGPDLLMPVEYIEAVARRA